MTNALTILESRNLPSTSCTKTILSAIIIFRENDNYLLLSRLETAITLASNQRTCTAIRREDILVVAHRHLFLMSTCYVICRGVLSHLSKMMVSCNNIPYLSATTCFPICPIEQHTQRMRFRWTGCREAFGVLWVQRRFAELGTKTSIVVDAHCDGGAQRTIGYYMLYDIFWEWRIVGSANNKIGMRWFLPHNVMRRLSRRQLGVGEIGAGSSLDETCVHRWVKLILTSVLGTMDRAKYDSVFHWLARTAAAPVVALLYIDEAGTVRLCSCKLTFREMVFHNRCYKFPFLWSDFLCSL